MRALHHTLAIVMSVAYLAFAAAASAQIIETVAGAGGDTNNGSQGAATEINIDEPFGVEFGPDGALTICEEGQNRVFRLDTASGQLTTVAGSGERGYSGDGEPATEARLYEPYEVRFDAQGHMFFVEMRNHVIRRVDRQTGVITTVAGTGEQGYGGDGGPAEKAQFSQPHSIAFDNQGRLYVADIGNHRIRRIDMSSGIIESIAGNGTKKLPQEGAARDRPMLGPRALFITGDTLWIALREGNSVWRMSIASGELEHLAGNGSKGYSGDGGPPKDATFNGPKGIVADAQQRVWIVDTENQVIRFLDVRQQLLSTVAGSGPAARGYGGDGGPALKAKMDRPHGICLGADGAIYIGDTNNHRVRRVYFAEPNTSGVR